MYIVQCIQTSLWGFGGGNLYNNIGELIRISGTQAPCSLRITEDPEARNNNFYPLESFLPDFYSILP